MLEIQDFYLSQFSPHREALITPRSYWISLYEYNSTGRLTVLASTGISKKGSSASVWTLHETTSHTLQNWAILHNRSNSHSSGISHNQHEGMCEVLCNIRNPFGGLFKWVIIFFIYTLQTIHVFYTPGAQGLDESKKVVGIFTSLL